MNEENIIECFEDTAETGVGHVLRANGRHAGNAEGEVIILDYARHRDLVESKRLLYEETKYIPASIRRFLNKIGRFLNSQGNWGENEVTLTMPSRSEIQKSASVREKNAEEDN